MVPVGDGRRKPAGGGGGQPADPAVRPDMVIVVGEPLDNVCGNGPAFAFPIAKRFYREHLGWSNWF